MKKDSIIDQFRDILTQSKNWVELEVEYAKLTLAEKFTILGGAVVLGAVCMMLAQIVFILLAFCLVDLFKLVMSPALANLCVGGIIMLIIALIIVFKKTLILDPIAKFITRLFLDRKK